MKQFMSSVFAIACISALCLVLAGCGSQGSSSASSSAKSESASASAAASSVAASSAAASSAATNPAEPAANVNPADINPSQISGNDSAPDIWRLNGDASAEGIRFSRYDNDAGLSFIRVNAAGQDGDSEFNLVITDEKHLRTPLGMAPKIDIVFVDDMTCYDYVTNNWYSRSAK